jgi:single-strand DNA-binding protein
MIIGRLGRDPEMRYTPSGRPVTTFNVATTRTWNSSDGERHSETEWLMLSPGEVWLKFAKDISPKINRYILKVVYKLDHGKTTLEINAAQLR